MVTLRSQNGKIIVQNGAVGVTNDCCCVSGPQCMCGETTISFIANDGGVLPGSWDTEEEALAALAEYKSAVGMGRPPQIGGDGGDGMTFDNAVAALQGYGCGFISVFQGGVDPDWHYGTEGWIAISPSISVRCCGQFLPDGTSYENDEPCGLNFMPPCVLKPGAIDTYPWVLDGGGNVLFPCVDDGSYVFCAEYIPGIPTECLRGPCENLMTQCENPLP